MSRTKLDESAKPLYVQIKDIYRHKILTQELKRGDKIESELEIQKKFSVSRITVRQAMLDLEKEGMVKRGRGKGTFVIWRPGFEIPLNKFSGFTAEMERQGAEVATLQLQVSRRSMDPKTERMFKKHVKEEMICVERVRTVDDIKAVFSRSYYPLDDGLPEDEQEYGESVYEMLKERGVGAPARTKEWMHTELPNEEVEKALNIAANQPVLVCCCEVFDKDDQVIEYGVNYYRGDMYSFTYELKDE
ncbi:GntR family transcriptional regulator [Catenisphaera adipataccumulans]|jgi:GntR family transcriptional regulator|uniref:GntR family transcriptional regulator n=1 Tax=Catenisphaera adipataccumulans TaxID=700500 RepID=A0A7W8CY35_9FIRM|nr:GntR family transcriptional regulator [Catenisphaera adipataccumulans]MBB5183511.1 GntR family transcriptional regulator [Catenisphaera adipataccumulans]